MGSSISVGIDSALKDRNSIKDQRGSKKHHRSRSSHSRRRHSHSDKSSRHSKSTTALGSMLENTEFCAPDNGSSSFAYIE
ncbi:hypothetical protein ABK040_010322 [Willaertia magna]